LLDVGRLTLIGHAIYPHRIRVQLHPPVISRNLDFKVDFLSVLFGGSDHDIGDAKVRAIFAVLVETCQGTISW
jgi:hypothetical protein